MLAAKSSTILHASGSPTAFLVSFRATASQLAGVLQRSRPWKFCILPRPISGYCHWILPCPMSGPFASPSAWGQRGWLLVKLLRGSGRNSYTNLAPKHPSCSPSTCRLPVDTLDALRGWSHLALVPPVSNHTALPPFPVAGLVHGSWLQTAKHSFKLAVAWSSRLPRYQMILSSRRSRLQKSHLNSRRPAGHSAPHCTSDLTQLAPPFTTSSCATEPCRFPCPGWRVGMGLRLPCASKHTVIRRAWPSL